MKIKKPKLMLFRDECIEKLKEESSKLKPILTVDYHPRLNRIVTGGMDTNIKIWEIIPLLSNKDQLTGEEKENNGDRFADLKLIAEMDPIYDQTKTVNIARWSPCGNYIATGCGRGATIIWKKKKDSSF
jgi:WD40 repeat protein